MEASREVWSGDWEGPRAVPRLGYGTRSRPSSLDPLMTAARAPITACLPLAQYPRLAISDLLWLERSQQSARCYQVDPVGVQVRPSIRQFLVAEPLLLPPERLALSRPGAPAGPFPPLSPPHRPYHRAACS